MSSYGKMSNTPFHVEDPRYKYAVEHDDTIIPKDSSKKTATPKLYQKCIYRTKYTDSCKLWFIEGSKCKHKKCPYQYTTKRRKENCLQCIQMSIENGIPICALRKKPIQEEMGTYCSYFLSEQSDNASLVTLNNNSIISQKDFLILSATCYSLFVSTIKTGDENDFVLFQHEIEKLGISIPPFSREQAIFAGLMLEIEKDETRSFTTTTIQSIDKFREIVLTFDQYL